MSRKKLESRVRQFQEGDSISLRAEAAHISSVRRRRRSADEEAVRAARALSLVRMGELSAGRQALEGASLARQETSPFWGILTDPTRRPPVPRSALSQKVWDAEPVEPVTLDPLEFLDWSSESTPRSCRWAVRDDLR